MFVRNTIGTVLFLLLSLHIFGAGARPSFSLAAKRSSSASSLAVSLQYRTNAERMIAGLAPRAPTRVVASDQVVRRNSPSPIPYAGKIRVVRHSNGNFVGYFGQDLTDAGRFTITTSTATAVAVSFGYVSASLPVQLKITAVWMMLIFGTPNWPAIGAAGATLSNNVLASVVGSNEVPSGATPQNVGNSRGSGGSETYIWKYNISSGEITAEWVNPNGAIVTVYPYYVAAGADAGLHLSTNGNYGGGYIRLRIDLERWRRLYPFLLRLLDALDYDLVSTASVKFEPRRSAAFIPNQDLVTPLESTVSPNVRDAFRTPFASHGAFHVREMTNIKKIALELPLVTDQYYMENTSWGVIAVKLSSASGKGKGGQSVSLQFFYTFSDFASRDEQLALIMPQ
ncbi:hypothetical protein CVT24_003320 [Panaeolus cyanescens]|uniref:Uncharacterized protein n=1 Tax=Panaeolus cyanescens TaxID=181874 RepID=A0A409WT84_9AGAR|nr:hypothetical protein CVT24_003320 [Panaeolus cyanescens]